MTDKELIKQEIERRIKESSSKNDISEGALALDSLLDFIDSLPEEPKCIYNRTLDERKKFCKYCSATCGVRIEKEPVSEDLEEEINRIGKNEYFNFSDWKSIARHFAEWGRNHFEDKSEMVSEDLEEAAELYYEEDCTYEGDARVINNEHDVWFPSQAIEDAFIAGAEWQKQQMKEALQTEYEKGRFDMREEMMKGAVN